MLYLDTSALVKLERSEAESVALHSFVVDEEVVTSQVAIVELTRALTRASPALGNGLARTILSRCHLINLTSELLDVAASIPPSSIRSLDAIHLASALDARHARPGVTFVAYDDRLLAAAAAAGLPVASPGR